MTRTVYAYTDSVEFGGAERSLATLLAGLSGVGWRPVLLHPDAAGLDPLLQAIAPYGIEHRVVRSMPEGIGGAAHALALIRMLRTDRPDVFHAHLTWPFGCKWALAAACAARVPAVVGTAHLFVEVPVGASRRVQLRLLSRWVDRIIAVSSDTRRRYAEALGWPAERIAVIPNAAAAAGLPDTAVERALAEIDDASGRLVALVPARLDAQKGHRYLLEAARGLPGVRFLLAGDGPLRDALAAEAERLGVADRVHFLGFRDDVPALMRASDLVVLPSLFEGLPVALIEAMAAGRPVVATAIGGTRELVIDGETGILVPPADPDALVAAIDRLARDDGLAARLGAGGSERARRHFSPEAMVSTVAGEYERILGSAAA